MRNKTEQYHTRLMKYTCDTLGHILSHVTQEQATTLRDGPEGWTILEVVCHLRDFDEFFYGRVQMMLAQENPKLPFYDHEALAVERNYNAQNLAQAYAGLEASRARFIALFQSLDESDWSRIGDHPERESFTMVDALLQVALHDADHLEQITRILREG